MIAKLKAFLVHFSVSALVLGSFFLLLFFFWYRGFFAVIDVDRPLLLLVGIDLILGPLLTFIVYRKGKRTLVFDLSVIVLLQIVAFVYGAYVIYQGKPSLMVDYNGRFEVVFEKEIPANKQAELQTSGLFSQPQYASINTDKVNSGLPVYENLEYLEPLPKNFWETAEGSSESRNIPLRRVLVVGGIKEPALLEKLHAQGYELKDVAFHDLMKDGLIHVLATDKSNHELLFVLSQF